MESNLHTSELLIFATTGILIMIGLAVLMISYSSSAKRKILQQRMDAQANELRHQQELLERNLLVQEEERQRIAAQLHDDIGSKLGVLNLTLHRLRRSDTNTEQSVVMYEEITELITNALETTRRISHELLPPTLEDFGLLEALGEFVEGVRKTGAVEVDLTYNITRADLPDTTTELNLFRIIQELTSNTLKYAQAKYITIALMKADDQINVHYHDDGLGFDLESTPSKGLGLRNLENRVRIIDAKYEIRSAVGEGFEANIYFEYKAKQYNGIH